MKNLFLLLLIIISLSNSNAQTVKVYLNSKGEKITRIETQSNKGGAFVKEYKGSIYLFDEFQMGKIMMQGGKIVEAPILFNIVKDVIIAKINNEEVILNNVNFSIGEHSFVAIKGSYYQLLYDNFQLSDSLKSNRITILKRNVAIPRAYKSAGYQTATDYDGEFLTEETFFFFTPQNKLIYFEIKKKSIKNALDKQNIVLNKDSEDKLIDIKNINDFIKILDKN
jgi:hypothetical protein